MNMQGRIGAALTLLMIMLVGGTQAAEKEMPLLFKEDFEHGGHVKWKTTDPDPAQSVWKIIEAGKPGNHVLRCSGVAKYDPPFRSPWSIALLRDVIVGNFELSATVQETHIDAGPHRDLCFFWGYQD